MDFENDTSRKVARRSGSDLDTYKTCAVGICGADFGSGHYSQVVTAIDLNVHYLFLFESTGSNPVGVATEREELFVLHHEGAQPFHYTTPSTKSGLIVGGEYEDYKILTSDITCWEVKKHYGLTLSAICAEQQR